MKKLVVIFLLLALPMASFVLGFRVGNETGVYSELTYKGILATYYLDQLNSNNTNAMRISFESDIQAAKWAHSELQSPLYKYGAKIAAVPTALDNPDYISRLTAHSPKSSE